MTDAGGTIRKIAKNRTSGASELLGEAIDVVQRALRDGSDLRTLGAALVRAQPAMASLWNVVGQAIAANGNVALFERYVAQLERAPRTLAQHAVNVLLLGDDSSTLHVTTLSFSGTVLSTVEELARHRAVHVSCAEGRPALEGQRLAHRLAGAGIPVTYYADATLEQSLDTAHVVIAGADAISPEWFLNKSGTRMLAAAAAQRGLPVYVCATRDKFLSRALARQLSVRDEPPAEIWDSPPAGVTVRNRYFERTPLDLVTAVISDLGVLGAALVPDACPSSHEALLLDLTAT